MYTNVLSFCTLFVHLLHALIAFCCLYYKTAGLNDAYAICICEGSLYLLSCEASWMKWNRTLRWWFSKYEATWSAHIDTYIIITSLLKHQVSSWRSPPSSLCVNSPWPIRHLRYWTVNTPPISKASCAGGSQEGLLAAGRPQGEAVGCLSLT